MRPSTSSPRRARGRSLSNGRRGKVGKKEVGEDGKVRGQGARSREHGAERMRQGAERMGQGAEG